MKTSERITRRLIELREIRDTKRARGLKDGTLAIILNENGIPIVVSVEEPIEKPILTLAERFHRLAEEKT